MTQNTAFDAPWLFAVARVFERTQAPLYLVGGAVRNPLMGLPLSDVDVCGPLRPELVCDICQGTDVHAHLRAAHFGTVELHTTDAQGVHHMAEYTTWREDSYRCGHKPDSVRFTTDIRVDALRRDFSVNALYRGVRPDGLGPVIDPTGGLAHLHEGILHTVTPDPDRVLSEDGLRILRAARFQAELGLKPTPQLLASLQKNVGLLRDIAPERLRDEWQKTLMADFRYPMLQRNSPATAEGLATIVQCGAWPMLFGALPFDASAAHALSRLATPTLPARMALLFHRSDAQAVRKTMIALCCAKREAGEAAAILTALNGFGGDLFALARLGRETVQAAYAVCLALGDEACIATAASAVSALAGKPMSLKELAVTGNDLIPLLQSKGIPLSKMGQVLSALWQRTVEGQSPNEKAVLLRIVESGDAPRGAGL